MVPGSKKKTSLLEPKWGRNDLWLGGRFCKERVKRSKRRSEPRGPSLTGDTFGDIGGGKDFKPRGERGLGRGGHPPTEVWGKKKNHQDGKESKWGEE